MKKIKIKEKLFGSLKRKIITFLVLGSIIGAGVYINLTITPNAEKMLSTYMQLEEYQEGYGKIYLSQFDGSRILWGKLDTKRKNEMYCLVENQMTAIEYTGALVKIEEVKIDKNKYSGFNEIQITIKNEGQKDVKYVKVNLFFKDENGNIIYSDWTNDNAIIKPGATQVLSKMVEKNSDWQKVYAEIESVKY